MKTQIKSFFHENDELISSFSAVALGTILGFCLSSFVQDRINDYVLKTCPTKRVFNVDSFITKRGAFYCAKETD